MYLAKNQVYRSKSNVGKRLKWRVETWRFALGATHIRCSRLPGSQ